MDKYDRMLLSALLEDGRASYAQLARTVNLSAPAVAERVAKLEASGLEREVEPAGDRGEQLGLDPHRPGFHGGQPGKSGK